MGLRLIYGRAGTGKSEKCYKEISEKIKQNNKILIITPEQFSFTAEKKLMEAIETEAVFNAEVVTFSRMAYRVIQEIGGRTETNLSKCGKAMLIYSILNNCKKDLKFLGKTDENVDMAGTAITEFKKHGISVEQLKQETEKQSDIYLKNKLNDINMIYEKFQEQIAGKYIDETDLLTILAQNVDKVPDFKDNLIYIDEFAGFTSQEYDIIQKLVKIAKQVTITICTDTIHEIKNADTDIFYSNQITINKLLQISSEKISTVHLDKIFRQAARSKIIVNAHRVNNGQKFIQKDDSELSENAKEDFFFIKENNQEKILEQVLSLCNGRLKKFGDYDFFENIQVLTPTKKGMLGTKELNKSLQQELNPPREGEPEKASMGVIFRIGDRIMQTKNNYDMYWERREGDSIETGNGVFNGEIGTITNINEKEKNIRIKFDDDKVCWYEFNDLEQIDHSYCITIHKAQGSEFDVVIMIVPQAAPMLLTRNLLYTGLTRAKKLLIVIGNDRVVDFMINNVDSKKRNTGLEYKLKNT